jgi:uncharacterized integral membrane protein
MINGFSFFIGGVIGLVMGTLMTFFICLTYMRALERELKKQVKEERK